jgi:prepilin signal peptidase PulO-like enzyme (type II secretory pathway)
MVIVSCIIGAVIVALLSYIIIHIIGKQRKLDIPMNKLIVYEIVVFAVSLAVGITGFEGREILEMILVYLMNSLMSVVAYLDFKYHFISNRLLLIFMILWLGILGLEIIIETEVGLQLLFQGLLGAIVGGLIFLLCYLLSRGQLGAGDVKLVFVMGLYLTGYRIIGAIFYAVILCFIYSLILLLSKKIGLKDGVPLAPFLYIGTIIAYLVLS